MARTPLTVQELGAEGAQKLEDIAFTSGVAADDLEFPNDGRTLLLIDNGGASSQDAAVISVADPHGRTGDLTVSTTNAKISMAGPFPKSLWNQADGMVHVDITTEDVFSFAAVKLPA